MTACPRVPTPSPTPIETVRALMKALDSGAYDEQWSRLADFLRYNPGARHRRRLVLLALEHHAAGAATVLDVGCGLGETIAFLSDHLDGASFTGVDLSPLAIASCREHFPEHQWAVADIVAGELAGSFDAIVCSELLEHLDDPERALVRIVRALRPGGTIVVTVPAGQVFATERAVGHVDHPTPDALRSWCATAGLDVVELRRWGWPGYLWLKKAANVDPERSMAAFGSGRYSWLKRRANDAAFLVAGLGSRRDDPRGPQTLLVARRRDA